ncbi:trafficking protein particle complex [Seminavis robusta]|uniref:Trafficking protein particle complex n=1 Tax=Seminavis robusta TaxID=568900 RepID=A0A9N8E6Y5_9STRA|nr:trafficking protein particle complex [Seminavis robusta]|eukprot:Sro616_g175920.1 trafficking protein particle complex (1550) ;mRNA; r:10561-15543
MSGIAISPNNTNSSVTTASESASITSNSSSSQHYYNPRPKEEPPSIPLTAFCPSKINYLAHRQCSIPVLVLGTESAHKLAWKNQLRLVDLLEGLARTLPEYSTRQIPPFRSIFKSLSLSWKDVPLTFVTPEQLAQPMNYETAQEILQQQAQLQQADGNLTDELNLLEDQVDTLLQDAPNQNCYDYMSDYEERVKQQKQVVKDAYALTSPLNIPWLLRYRHAIDASTDQMPHDLIACPPICLLICTTQEVNPLVDCLRELGSRHYLPPCFSNGLYDPKAMRQEALVLHDTVDGPRDWDEAGLRSSLQRHFGPNASIVRINGILPQTAMQLSREETTDEWGGAGQCGNCLSHSDRVVLRQYLEGLTTSSILPALERRLSDLNVIVSDRKKGVKNVFKSFWRKPKEANPEESISKQKSEVTYRYDTIESQTRLLADTLFLVKDYDAALGMYRLIRDDYKTDKSMMHYASVQEMMALCMFFVDPYSRAKEIVSHIETALLAYSKAAEDERPTPAGQNKNQRPNTATHATRCATRLCLWLSSTNETILGGRHLEVADLLASASSHETSLGAAVLLEQSSSQYFQADLYRKYAFHMLMSGHMFRTAQQDSHAFRCFTSALYLYRDKPWNELHNHLRSALAAQLYSMGRMAVSVQLYARLVGIPSGGSVSVKSQQKFVNNLLFICNEHPKKALVGADRMAAPAELSNRERDRYRQDRLDRIVEVIEYTQGAQRILELPRVRLPTVVDESLLVDTPEDRTGPSDCPSSLGVVEKGCDDTWQELQIMTVAELRAADASKGDNPDDEVTTKALAKIDDNDIRSVIAQIDKEKQARHLQERNKRSSSYKGEVPPVRARGEPIRVRFTLSNPLSIPVDMADIQLVAQMTNAEGRIFTNIEAIRITSTRTDKQTWTFASSDQQFQVPEFARLSPKSGGGSRAWTPGDNVEVPYFVVSKANISLDAQGATSISLGICPLIQGDLEVLGVRSRLLDDVWTYHPFSIKGPRLHNTRENRTKRARAEPVLLRSTVKQDMPCLTATLLKSQTEGSDDPLIQGQKESWTLRLSNIGTAPATNVSLKTNLPWINIVNDNDESSSGGNVTLSKVMSWENRAKSCCVGPTGTLMTIPLDGSHLRKRGFLQPGESVDVPIQIRAGSGDGLQDFYMLYRYELDDPSVPTNSKPQRWLKKMFKIPVYPSLSMKATLLPSTWSRREHILSLELTNHRNDRPNGIKVKLDKLSLLSRRYRLQQIPGQFANEDLEVDWRERVTAHYRVVPVGEESTACLLSECAFGADTATISESALSSDGDYLCLEKASAKFERTWNKHQIDLMNAQSVKDKEDQHPQSISSIRKANVGGGGPKRNKSREGLDEMDLDAVHPTSLSKLFPVEKSLSKLDLICTWSADVLANGNARVYGEHQLHSVVIRPATETSRCPITISATYPSDWSQDFEKDGPAYIPFKIVFRNQLVKSSVTFDVEIVKPQNFDLMGVCFFEHTLGGGEELEVPMQAVIESPGIFNLQSMKITLDAASDDPAAYDFGVQWLTTVKPAGSSVFKPEASGTAWV